MLLSPQIVKKFAENLANRKFNRHLVASFTKRYDKKLKGIYWRTINHKRNITDNLYHFAHFFENVRLLF